MRTRSTLLLSVIMGVAGLGACGRSTATSGDDQRPPGTPEQARASLASLPAPFNTADPIHGQRVFAQCAACHTDTQGGPNMTGPNLFGLFGRRVGTEPGYSYSDVLRSAGFVWDAPRLNTWISNPQIMLPGTKMSFAGLKDPKDRADVIAYLKVSTTAAP